MRASDLIDLLESIDPDSEVRLMTQSEWPFEYGIAGAWIAVPQPDACRVCGRTEASFVHQTAEEEIAVAAHDFEPYNEFMPSGKTGADEVLYIVEGPQLGYGTKLAWEELDQGREFWDSLAGEPAHTGADA